MTEVREAGRATTLSVASLTAVVIGSMVGAGVFSLPAQFAAETGVVGALVAWAVAGAGMFMLALVFQRLAVRRPELDAGIYAYAKAGFGQYLGFFSAFGYWASACVGNVTYWVLIMSTIGAVVPALGEGDTVVAVLLASAGLWGSYAVIRRGVREAAAINRIVTVAKMVPIVVFVLITAFAFHPSVFVENLHGAPGTGALFEQVRGTLLVTVFVFLGVEAASVYSRHARSRRDVGKATIFGFLSVFAVFASVTMVAYGTLPMSEIAALRQPSMAGVLETATGSWGSAFISIGLVVSVLGAYLAWTLMAAEVLLVAARDDDMPRFLRRTTGDDVPVNALTLTTALSQVVLVLTLLSQNAFDFALSMTSSLVLIPYVLAAGFAVRLAWTDRSGRVVALLATVYTAFLLVAAGPTYVLVSFLLYAPATVLFVMARREQGRRVFSPGERVLFVVSVLTAVAAVVALVAGWVTL